MAEYILPLQKLIDQFRRLPGIGGKTAVRLAFSVLDSSDEQAAQFAEAILSAKRDVCICKRCCNIAMNDLCPICEDENREEGVVCVVEAPKDVMAFERVREFRGRYHVLGGVLSPMNGVGPDKLRIKELLARISEEAITEVIVATNATVEGEATAMYLARLLEPFGVSVSRLAFGLPVGGDVEYTDEVTLHRALEGRRTILS
jgi:recombination protein RecR